ncbi:MAG TPA: DUF29 domain-containing protein [Lamprocystis sp. (in: g-proteobacteria)]|nr:DUF29 domain-containing protein [Lamprocystis sp. (in: g-proteobacteria)]
MMALAFKAQPPAPVAGLYETDYSRWLFENARLLGEGRFAEADIANVMEELEDMGRSEYRAIESHLSVLLLHLLKWEFQPQQRGNGWRGSIFNSRRAIAKRLKESPSLRGRLVEVLREAYPDARYNAANETGLPDSAFPAECPYHVDEALNPGFWPGAE